MDRSTAYVWACLLGPGSYFAWLGFHGHHPLTDGSQIGDYAAWQVPLAALTYLGGCFALGRVWGASPVAIGLAAGLTLAASAGLDWGTAPGAGTGVWLAGIVPIAVVAPVIGWGAAYAGRRFLRLR